MVVEAKTKDKQTTNSDQPSERELKQKARRPVKVKGTALGKGDALYLGVFEALAGQGTTNESSDLWVELFQTCAEDPGEWYNRKFYYDEERDTNSHSSLANMIRRNGHIKEETNEYNTTWCRKLRELCKIYGGEFQAEYTRGTVKSDAPSKGKTMSIVFVRFVKTPRKPSIQDAMAVHSDRRG